MQKYHIKYQIAALLEFDVKADGIEQARSLAHDYCDEADLGEITEVLMGEAQEIKAIKSRDELVEDINEIIDEYGRSMDADPDALDQLCTGEWLDWFIGVTESILLSVKRGNASLDKRMVGKTEKLLDSYLNSTDDMSDPDWREDDYWAYDFYELMKEIKSCMGEKDA